MLALHGGHQVAQNSTITTLSLFSAKEKVSVLSHFFAFISGASSPAEAVHPGIVIPIAKIEISNTKINLNFIMVFYSGFKLTK